MKSGKFAKAISAFTKAKDMGYIAKYCDQAIAECRQLQR
jgi:hypothetical protein